MNVATRFLVNGRRGLRAIEQPGDGGATLYYGDFGKGIRRIWSPPPDFDSLEAAGRPRSWRPFVVSIVLHLLLFLAILISSGFRLVPPQPRLQDATGIDVTFAEDGGRRQMTQSQLTPEPGRSGDGRERDAEAPKTSVATPLPVDAMRVPTGVPLSDATTDAPPAPAPKSAIDADQSLSKTDTPRAAPTPVDRADEDRWEGAVLARIERKRRYPAEALRNGLGDVVMIRITIDRRGRLLLAELVKSHGIAILDKEALALAKRAEPYPEPPASVVGDAIQLLVPIEYILKRNN